MPPIIKESGPDEENFRVVPKIEVIDNCELMFPSWSVRRKTSIGKDKDVMGVKTILSILNCNKLFLRPIDGWLCSGFFPGKIYIKNVQLVMIDVSIFSYEIF